jgi:hypothetical protein
MESIKIEKEDFENLLSSYNWESLNAGDEGSKNINVINFTKTTMGALISQFIRIYVLSNDAIWGDFEDDQKILISHSPGIFDIMKEKSFAKSSVFLEP